MRCQGSSQCLLRQFSDWLPVQLASIVSTNFEAQSGPSLQQHRAGQLHKAVHDLAGDHGIFMTYAYQPLL